MANDILSNLNTELLANDFHSFLASQAPGSLPSGPASRFREGVLLSPMDQILALNGFDLDEVFSKTLPNPPPLAALESTSGEAVDFEGRSKIIDAISAVESLALSEDALKALNSIVLDGKALTPIGPLPEAIVELLNNNSGIGSATDLLLQLGELSNLMGGPPPPGEKNVAEILIELMNATNISDSAILLQALRSSPTLLKEALSIIKSNKYDDLKVLFSEQLPKYTLLIAALERSSRELGIVEFQKKIIDAISAVESLGLSPDALIALTSIVLDTKAVVETGRLPDTIVQLLNTNSGFTNATDLLLHLGELFSLIGDTPLSGDNDLARTLFDLMRDMNTSDTATLLQTLRANPLLLREALFDPITGTSGNLGNTTRSLRISSAFNSDSVTGTPQPETFWASRAGGTRLIGGGGSDLFVIPLSTNPFAQKVIIEDFESATESKIVLDVSDYSQSLGVSFKLAKNSKQVSRLARTKASFIFNSDTHELLLNGNGRKRGLGLSGGPILMLENDSALGSTDLLIFRDNNLRQLDGTAFLG